MSRNPNPLLLEIRIDGPGVEPGRIALPVLYKICRQVQETVNRQAQAIESRESGQPIKESKAQECKLELIGLVKDGSTRLQFAPASKQLVLIPHIDSLGVEAVAAVAATLRAVNQIRGHWTPPDSRVLDALEELGSVFEEGIDILEWIASQGGRKTTAEFVRTALLRIKSRKQEMLPLAEGPSKRPDRPVRVAPPSPIQESFLEGLLESAGGSVRITPRSGDSTVITYGADKAASVLNAIHRPVRVRVDKEAGKIVDIELADEEREPFDAARFFANKTIDQLRTEQNVPAITDLDSLGEVIPEEDLEEFVAEIYREREA
jgi:hypothetical protein